MHGIRQPGLLGAGGPPHTAGRGFNEAWRIADSPVIDKGNSFCIANDDQRDLARCVSSPDIGSVELQTVEDVVFREFFDVP
jgi:hypothetical protein